MTTAATKGPKQVAINDIGSADDFLAEVEKTLKFFTTVTSSREQL